MVDVRAAHPSARQDPVGAMLFLQLPASNRLAGPSVGVAGSSGSIFMAPACSAILFPPWTA